MAAWEYKVTNHVMDELKKCIESKTTRPVISCDNAGGCMVNDVCALGTDTLASALNELGKEGWELHYYQLSPWRIALHLEKAKVMLLKKCGSTTPPFLINQLNTKHYTRRLLWEAH